MKKDHKIWDEVEKTLGVFDNDVMPEENPYLFTRIKAEAENRKRIRKKKYAFKLSLNQALLIIILVINIITLAFYYNKTGKQALHEKLVSGLREELQIDQTQNNF